MLRILWHREELVADGFFEDGPDPMGEEDPLKGIFRGYSHTYLAVTTWRVILGYLPNGEFSSHEFVNTEPKIQTSGGKFYFTHKNPILKTGSTPTRRSTYSISKEVARAIELNLTNKKPTQIEETKIHLSRKSWGEGPLADIARIKSGRDHMLIEVCATCTGTMLVPEAIDPVPDNGNLHCRTCLRVRLKGKSLI